MASSWKASTLRCGVRWSSGTSLIENVLPAAGAAAAPVLLGVAPAGAAAASDTTARPVARLARPVLMCRPPSRLSLVQLLHVALLAQPIEGAVELGLGGRDLVADDVRQARHRRAFDL